MRKKDYYNNHQPLWDKYYAGTLKWIPADKDDAMLVQDMEESHIQNCIAYMGKRCVHPKHGVNFKFLTWIKILTMELEHRYTDEDPVEKPEMSYQSIH